MLLRLLPQPTSTNPAPLTILFTLPLPTHPYTSRSLPLPPALVAHKALCVQEDLECPNVLLGEKSSWICGIIDDVTFSLPLSSITVNFIDGTSTSLPISISCEAQLHRVVEEVQLSFTAPTTVPNSPRTSTSSIASTSSASSSSSRVPSNPATPRRTPSSLLLSLLSPLLPSGSSLTQPRPSLAAPPCAPARVHRRAARSLLVETYRRYVLPTLKAQLPCSYFPWAIASETSRQMEEFTRVQTEINRIIDSCGVTREALNRRVSSPEVTRSRSSSSSSVGSLADDESDSDSDSNPTPITPATSVFTSSACPTPYRKASSPSPSNYLLSIPPAHALPTQFRMSYATQLSRLTAIASRVSQIKKLNSRYEREEGKRKWLEGLERGRLSDKSLRRAYSNCEYPSSAPQCFTAEVNRNSKLWQSFTLEDLQKQQESEEEFRLNSQHPAMMDISDLEECSSGHFIETVSVDSGSESDEESQGPITPPKTRCNSTDERPLLGITTTNDLNIIDSLPTQRPILERKLALITDRMSVLSPDLIETDDELWEDEDEIVKTPISLSPPSIKQLTLEVLPNGLKTKTLQDNSNDFEQELEESNEGWRIYA